ncbi:MAG: VWA domain-containing protein, partial [Chloroflexi bacterium]|nr:VWA domain-containing protein [Chloroflexota bacterium]
DHSGSMSGAKWEAADWTVKSFLSGLSSGDTFNLGLFHNDTRWLAPAPLPATTKNVDSAITFLEQYRDSGGTELGVALEQALDLKRSSGERARHVLIVTDAEVSDAGRILRLVAAESRRADRRRVSVLCIDAAPNSHLALELAERGGGVAKFLTSRPDEEDVTTALDEVLADWAAPVLSGLWLAVNRPGLEAAGRDVLGQGEGGAGAIDLGDLPSGRSVWVAGRVARGDGSELTLRLTTSKGEVASCSLDPSAEAATRPALKALFGARRVLGLEYLLSGHFSSEDLSDQLAQLGYDPQRALAGDSGRSAKLYAENARKDAREALRDLLVAEALDYGLASAETAFVAVRREAGKPVEATVAVANALPSGWSDQFLTAGGPPMMATMAMAPIAPMPASPPMSAPTGAFRVADTGSAPPGYVADKALREPKSTLGGLGKRLASFFGRDAAAALDAAPAESTAPLAAPDHVVFSGAPNLASGEAVLFDSSAAGIEATIPERATISKLRLRFPSGAPDAAELGADLQLMVFVGDLASPRAKVRVADLIRQRGERPLNLSKQPGEVVRIVLVDPAGVWRDRSPRVEIELIW